ncbi:PLP-dependent aminotransferase family protein [Caloramator sp. E03]|uniref:MocR-like pyridoxine biosynthesis transcription factor PdxR n=1 Tax=Caloramator sp. E03 TaxID=2576307 RepID=UPI001110C196|nr:PLP-dependent aminotransferase family protein [Caloramator sp. E03]QCX34581.1 PLP-dependent aminotransferase family protein [Caloramator sp. E03]
MFKDIKLSEGRPYYLQIKDYVKKLILNGVYVKDDKLPSTRELSSILNVSRNTVVEAYRYLEDEGFIKNVPNKGAFVSYSAINNNENYFIKWDDKITNYALLADELDTYKHDIRWEKGMISFKSISPDDRLFDIEDFKKAFLNRIAIEERKILNYGYAKGYKPLIDYLLKYMENKGVNIINKDIIITNGFTEGFDIVLSALVNRGDRIICENPTHNTAIKIMKLHGLDIKGIEIYEDGINTKVLKEELTKKGAKLIFLIPSYHNPTGIIMSPEKRIEVYNIVKEFNIPIIEDGFNEELRYSGSHISPIAAFSGSGNGVIYIGSFSKVLFPGIRIGWILADKDLIYYFESIKRSRNIHTSFLDQAILYEYLSVGNFEKYINKVRKVYKEKYEWTINCIKKYIPYKRLLGEGGLHVFIELDGIKSREVLSESIKKGVIFTPGDIFYTDGKGENSLRIGFSRVDYEDIEKGIKILGDVIKNKRKGD